MAEVTKKKGPPKGGGSRKGKKNKRTLIREALRKAEGKPMGKKAASSAVRATEIMRKVANSFLALASKYQPSAPANDEKKFANYLRMAADVAKDLAPYEDSRLASTILRGDPEQPIHHRIEIEYV